MNLSDYISEEALDALVGIAMAEDLASGEDLTSTSLVPEEAQSTAVMLTREDCVVSGTPVAAAVFKYVEPSLDITVSAEDGTTLQAGAEIMRIVGSSRAILTAERTALNYMQRMTGIASMTASFVKIASPHGTKILDTRKTTPGLRGIEKYAVKCGGGTNHRMGLHDMVLIKDNHRKLWGEQGGDLGKAVVKARDSVGPDVQVEIEVESIDELRSALEGKPDWALLDNMSPSDMADCVVECGGRCKLEASGGITLENIAAAAASGVDAVSLGCLTHSAPSADLSLEFE